MSESTQLDAEARLAADHDGTYKTELIGTLEKHRDAIAFHQQGFLPPDEYQVIEHMARAVDVALTVVEAYETGSSDRSSENGQTDGFAPIIHI
jgi:hypothetical protein